MKRNVFIMSVVFAVFVMLICSIKQTAADQKQLAKQYISQGLYDEAMSAYTQSNAHMVIFKRTIRLFGEFNAFLALLGMMFFITGMMLKKPHAAKVKSLKFTQHFKA